MKFFIVLFAIVAAVSAGYISHAIPQPWAAPAVHSSPIAHEPAPWAPEPVAPWAPHAPWAPAPKYIKIAAPIEHHHKEIHHAHFIPQQPAIPPPHPKHLALHGNEHVTRLHYSGPHVPHPHLVGEEHYVPHAEPAIAVVKHGHGW